MYVFSKKKGNKSLNFFYKLELYFYNITNIILNCGDLYHGMFWFNIQKLLLFSFNK